MSFATGSQGRLIIAPQSTFETFNATASDYELISFDSESIGATKDEITSDLLRSDRNVEYMIYGNRNVRGSVEFDLVYGMLDTIVLPSLMFDAWGTPDQWAASTAYTVGDAVIPTTSNTYYYKCTSAGTSGGTEPTWPTTPGDTVTDGTVTWECVANEDSVLTNGTTLKYMSMEKGFTDIGQYLRYTGMIADELSLTVRPNEIVKASFTFVGREESTVQSSSIAPSAAEPTGASSSPVDSFSGSIYEGGSSVDVVTEITINVKNNIDDGFVVGDAFKKAVFPGRFEVTGTLSVYCEDMTLYNKFVNGTESSIRLVLQDNPGNSYTIDLPRVLYSGETPKVSGEGPIVQNMPFRALYDSDEACTMRIIRAAA